VVVGGERPAGRGAHLPVGERRLDPGIEREEVLVGVLHEGTRAGLVELGRQSALALGLAGVGQRPAVGSRERDPADPAVGLEVEQQLRRLLVRQPGAVRDGGVVGHPAEADGVQSEQLGSARRRGHERHHAVPGAWDRNPLTPRWDGARTA